ncbi:MULTISPECIES: carbon monoxide dehydrogenase [unclassified Thiocapsa]|uniref:carbon monoxide dehydrogenase n=1 Tax=unclassified Thiocapsa TaxID=2641286 RepID=UPI0035B07A19
MSSQQQRQRHGVRKNMVKGIGGLLAGVALVLLARSLFKQRTPAPEALSTEPAQNAG